MMQTLQVIPTRFLAGNAPFIEELYEQYLATPAARPVNGVNIFDKLQQQGGARDVPHQPIQESFIQLAKQPRIRRVPSASADGASLQKQVAVLKPIPAYRGAGLALGQSGSAQAHGSIAGASWTLLPPWSHATWRCNSTPARWLARQKKAAAVGNPEKPQANVLRQYRPGVHAQRHRQKHWIMQRFELPVDPAFRQGRQKAHPQAKATAAETLERYLHTKYVGQSVAGRRRSTIAALDNLIQNSSSIGVQEIIIGMATVAVLGTRR